MGPGNQWHHQCQSVLWALRLVFNNFLRSRASRAPIGYSKVRYFENQLQRNRTQPSATGYLQQWGHYLLTALASSPLMTTQDWSSTATGTPDWLDCRNGSHLSPTKTPQALFKWVLESLSFANEASRRDLITSCLARTSQVSVETLLRPVFKLMLIMIV